MLIDLKSKVITEGFEVYSLFPGEGYKHRADMENRNLVFLDFPALSIPTRIEDFETKEFLLKVSMSNDLATWLKGMKDSKNKPSSNLSDYGKVRRTPKKSKYINSLQGLFYTARKGEIVILPDRGAFGDLLIGEFTTDSGSFEYITPTGYTNKYASRRVKWLAKVSQHKFSSDFLRSVRTANPFTLVQRSYRKQIFEQAYESYTFDGLISAKFQVRGEEFDSQDDFNFSRFMNYVAALCENYESENPGDGFPISIFDAIDDMNSEFAPLLTVNINSPGFISLSSNRLTPLVSAAIFTLASSACQMSATPAYPNPDTVEISVFSDPDDPCAVEVNDLVRHSLKVMGQDNWASLCKSVRKLDADAAIDAPAIVKP